MAADSYSFTGLHVAWMAGSIAAGLLLYFRPKPRLALAILILAHGLAFLGYYSGLPRPYAIGASSDRALVMGMAMAVADGGSPFDHVQIEFGNLEPFWTFFVAALSGFSSDRVPFVYDRMGLLSLALTAIGFFVAWARVAEGEREDDAGWRGALVAASVLGLSSMLLPSSNLQFFWQANFVFKPNHSLGFVFVGLMSRFFFSKTTWWRLALVQALLFWVFILDWGYVLPAIAFALLLERERAAAIRTSVAATIAALVAGAPYLAHLLRDYKPAAKEGLPEIWRDKLAEVLASPFLWTLDFGLLFALFVIGITLLYRLRREETVAFGFLLSGVLVTVCYLIGARVGFSPEPDEGYSYWRLVAATGAGYAIWRGGLLVRERLGARFTRAAWPIAFATTLACSLPAYFDPMTDDRLFPRSITPLPPPVLATAQWLRANTTVKSVLISAEGIMLSGVTGRRFLMVRPDQTADRAERESAEADILTSLDEETVQRAVRRYGVTHIVLDGKLREKYGDGVKGLGDRPWFQPETANAFARILSLRLR